MKIKKEKIKWNDSYEIFDVEILRKRSTTAVRRNGCLTFSRFTETFAYSVAVEIFRVSNQVPKVQ